MTDKPLPTVLLRRPEVLRRTGLGRTTLYDMMAKGTFPYRVQITPNIVGWPEDEVEAWLQGKINIRNLDVPSN